MQRADVQYTRPDASVQSRFPRPRRVTVALISCPPSVRHPHCILPPRPFPSHILHNMPTKEELLKEAEPLIASNPQRAEALFKEVIGSSPSFMLWCIS